MCGKYSLIANIGELAGRFEFDGDWDKLESNVAPTQEVLTVMGGETKRGGFMRWGLIPHWAKDPKIEARMINARAETVAEKPALRDTLRRRRCLVLADGFYEWQRVGGSKRPMCIFMRSREPFAFAGLWSVWRAPNGNRVPSCTFITTTANDLFRPIHNWMPVTIPRGVEEFWPDGSVDDPGAPSGGLSPYPDDDMEVCEVLTFVNSVANDEPEVIARIGRLRGVGPVMAPKAGDGASLPTFFYTEPRFGSRMPKGGDAGREDKTSAMNAMLKGPVS